MKTDRQKLILKLISANDVHNQEELQAMLLDNGINATQATLSRDVNELNLIKYRSADGGLCYRRKFLGVEPATPGASDGIISFEFAGNLAVIKTHPGFASVVAAAIDRTPQQGIAGTIAGDDTILMVLRVPVSRDAVLAELGMVLPGLYAKVL